jgi:hypothetical protein
MTDIAYRPAGRSTVRLYSRNGYGWTPRLAAIATAAEQIKAKTFAIDGEAVVLGPDGWSRFEELRSREATHPRSSMPSTSSSMTARICDRPFLDRKNALARLLRNTEAGILLNEHIVEEALSSSRTPAGSVPKASFRRRSMARIDPVGAAAGSRSASRQRRRAAGAERDVEPMSLRQRVPDEDRPVSEPMALRR